MASAQQSEPFGVRIGPDGPVVTGESTEVPVNAAGRLQTLIARLPDASHVMCSVVDLDEVLQELDEVTDFDRSALKTQELRDERNRAVAMWHDQKKRADTAEAERDELATKLASALQTVTALGQTIRAIPDAVANDAANLAHARAERDRLRQEIVDARGETAAEAIRADVAQAQRDEARAQLAGLREEWAFQYVSYGVTETSLVCESREEAEHEAGRHRRGDQIVHRLCGDWEAAEAPAASHDETGPGR